MLNSAIQKIPGIIENEPLSAHTTFKVGGSARYFFAAKSKEELLLAIKTADAAKVPYVVLGWGSNLLVSDDGYAGLVIKFTSDNFSVQGEEIYAEAGVNLSRLVGAATQAGLSGLEFAAGIPGSAGGAAAGNAGAYGQSFGDVVKSVAVYDQGQVKNISRAEMKYGYRESAYKHSSAVILSVTVVLRSAEPAKIQAQVRENILSRNAKLPFEPSAGCIFKNIELANIEIDRVKILKELEIDEREWQKVTAHGKLSAGYVIERLGLKGKQIGGCKISEKHSAFFVNVGGCRAEHVMMLISDVKMRARNRLGIQLQEEIKYLGF